MSPPRWAQNAAVGSSRLDVMNFLNEVAGNYPAAISFASGRPAEQFFQIDQWLGLIQQFVNYYGARNGLDLHSALNILAQYGRTKGIINELIAQQAGLDEHIDCDADQIATTAGCQEAITLSLTALCTDDRDVVLVRSPTYIGVTGAAGQYGIQLEPLVCNHANDAPHALASEVRRLRALGRRPRALYIIPDFDNPTGTVLGLEARQGRHSRSATATQGCPSSSSSGPRNRAFSRKMCKVSSSNSKTQAATDWAGDAWPTAGCPSRPPVRANTTPATGSDGPHSAG